MKRVALLTALSSLGLLLSACGSESEPEATQTTDAAPKPTRVAAAPDDPTAKMARAVGDGKPGAAVDLKYEIGDKPQVGMPTQIKLALVPRAGVDSMEATMAGMDGITIAGDLKVRFDSVEAGKAYEHTFSLLPEREGVYYVTVAVMTEISGSSIGRTFSIPFVVGTPSAQQKAAPEKDASGQPVQPMKAEER